MDYRIEQQASIVTDYYWILILGRDSPYDFVQNAEAAQDLKRLYLVVLKKFLDNPSYAKKN